MKKVWNFIYKYRIVIALVFLLIIGVFGFITVKQYLYPDDKLTVYGNRLDGIDKVKITDEKKNEIIKMIKEKAGIKDAKIDIQGKIINVSITASEKENTKEEMQKLCTEILLKFSSEEIKFYDFQFFIKNEDLNYNMIGYKNKISEEISYSDDVIVSEVEDEKKEQ
ncbi:unknown [Clostridium sp. CAG:1193]|nr:unknown [Clostridium sp. CAG:1193]